jgi:hypothetical protein
MFIDEMRNFGGSEDFESAIITQIIEELRYKPTCEKILVVIESDMRVAERPELLEM